MASQGRTAFSWLRGVGTRVYEAAPGRRGVAMAGAELLGLSAIVIAQPIFDALQRSTWAFSTEGVWGWRLVIFGAVLVLIPPAIMLAVELVVGLASHSLRGWVHLAWIGGLVALLAWQAVADNGNASRSAELLFFAAAALGVAAYLRFEAARSLLRYLAFAGPVVLAIFLFTSPIDNFVLASDPDVPEAHGHPRTPVVLVVFDEFPVSGLLNSKGEIDAKRFPNFAALARGSDWFKNTLAVAAATEQAVPAIESGDFSEPNSLAIYKEHPENLFTLLAPTYEIHAVETVTDLCPPSACSKGSGSLMSRYAHLLRTGIDTAQSLPMGIPSRLVRQIDLKYPASDKVDWVQRFLDDLRAPGGRPTLDFLHIGLPHVPYEYLPSGARYLSDGLDVQGTSREMWSKSPGYAVSGLQRMTLQLEYTDRVLGVIIKSLQNYGLYDKALFAVIADHGAAFFPGHSRRIPDSVNAGTILRVPLFLKRPNQRQGRTIRGPVRTIDLVPTIADEIGIHIPWKVDGRSLYSLPSKSWDDPYMQRWQKEVGFSPAPVSTSFKAALAQRNALVGRGSVYTLGAKPGELNREIRGAQPLGISITGPGSTYADPASGVYPSLIDGSILGSPVEDGAPLVARMNGHVVAVGQALDGGTRFTVMIPPSAFHRGENQLQLYAP